MSRFSATVQMDVRLQYRSQLYAIGVGVAVVLGLVARFAFDPSSYGTVLPVFYLLAIGGTTYMFGASMVLLEKSENTLAALRVSPVTTSEYLRSKALTLTSFAALESLIVLAITMPSVNVVPLLAGIVVLGLGYTWLGIGQVASYDSVTAFLIPTASTVSAVLQLPFLSAFDLGPAELWYLIPTQAPLLLMLGAFEPLEPWQWGYAIVVSAASLVATWVFARARFRHHIGLQEDA
jgi:hypothetical protein